ncbi:sensor histidine kinase [Leifsonia poae]|uniref:sensor histidine kinase n=1 Tax=Leifsonia poae TaxID=110933 RepID=UPI003D69A953
MTRLFLSFHRMLDPLAGVAYFIVCAVAEAGRHQFAPGGNKMTAAWWALLVVMSVAMATARRWPAAALSAIVAIPAAQLFFPGTLFPIWFYLGSAYILFAATAVVSGRRALALSGAAGAISALLTAGIVASWSTVTADWPLVATAPGQIDDGYTGTVLVNRIALILLLLLVAAVAWTGGIAVSARIGRRRAERAAADAAGRLGEVQTDLAIAEERERIAQDVHDIMAHSLSVILAQADGARLLAEERPAAVAPSLVTIADTARSSLTEVRMLIETLVGAPTSAEHPGLGDLDDLVRRLTDSGLTVTVERFGATGGLTGAQQLAVYRIVQEALTNALKHAGPGASARIALDARDDGLSLSVASHPADATRPAPEPSETGRGLVGMRERARLAGGWLDAGPDDDVPGGYLVTAYLPAAGRTAVSA